MTPHEPRALLQRLLIEGERAICRHALDREAMADLYTAADLLARKPSESARRTVDDHTVTFAAALVHLSGVGGNYLESGAKWRRVLMALIEDIRADFAFAVEAAKWPTA